MLRNSAGLTLLIGALTWASVPALGQLATGARLDYTATLGACAAVAAWLAVLWFLACLTFALLARLPGAFGHAGRWVSDRATPAVVRQLIEAFLGTALVVTVANHGAHAAPTPTSPQAAAAGPAVDVRAYAQPDRVGPSQVPLANGADLVGSAADPGPMLPPPDRPDGRPPTDRPHRRSAVVVRPGDSLWAIAARALPGDQRAAEIAAEWPRWYAANRAVIGNDPDLIHPGQRLRAPDR